MLQAGLLRGSRWRWTCVGQRLSFGAATRAPRGGSEGLGGRSLPCCLRLHYGNNSLLLQKVPRGPRQLLWPKGPWQGKWGQARLPFTRSEGLCAPLWASQADSGQPHTFSDTLGLVGWSVWAPGLFSVTPTPCFTWPRD